MTSYLTHEANLTRLDDMRRRAEGRRAARRSAVRHADAAASARREIEMHTTEPIAIRRATEADRAALERLAVLDSAPTPSGEVLIAEVADEPQAAVEVASGATIADPFRPTAELVELLGLRAARLHDGAESPRRLRFRTRSAYPAA